MKGRLAFVLIIVGIGVIAALAVLKSDQTSTDLPAISDDSEADATKVNIPTGIEQIQEDQGDQFPSPEDLISKYAPPDFHVVTLEPLPEDKRTWKEIYAALSLAADAGNPEAQFRLYRAASRCLLGPRTVAELDARLKSVNDPYYDGLGNYVTRRYDAEEAIAHFNAVYHQCKNAPDDEILRYVDWLTASADADYVRAKLKYIATEFPGDDDLDLSDPKVQARLKDRQQRSLKHLEEAKDQGSMDAIGDLIYIYGVPADQDQTADPVKAFAHLYAYAWYRFKYENNDRLFRYLAQDGMKLNPMEFQEGVRQGREILKAENCCFKISDKSGT